VADVFSEVPKCIDGNVDAKVCGVGGCDGNLEHQFSAAIEFTQECFGVEKPGVGQLLGLAMVGWHQ
jgi:hypothetical protein